MCCVDSSIEDISKWKKSETELIRNFIRKYKRNFRLEVEEFEVRRWNILKIRAQFIAFLKNNLLSNTIKRVERMNKRRKSLKVNKFKWTYSYPQPTSISNWLIWRNLELSFSAQIFFLHSINFFPFLCGCHITTILNLCVSSSCSFKLQRKRSYIKKFILTASLTCCVYIFVIITAKNFFFLWVRIVCSTFSSGINNSFGSNHWVENITRASERDRFDVISFNELLSHAWTLECWEDE